MKSRISVVLIVIVALAAMMMLPACMKDEEFIQESSDTVSSAKGLAAAEQDGLLNPIVVVPYGNSPKAKYFDFDTAIQTYDGSRSGVGFQFRNSIDLLVPVIISRDRCFLEIDNTKTTPTVRLIYATYRDSNGLAGLFDSFVVSEVTDYEYYLGYDCVDTAIVSMSQADFDRGVWSPDGPTAAIASTPESSTQ